MCYISMSLSVKDMQCMRWTSVICGGHRLSLADSFCFAATGGRWLMDPQPSRSEVLFHRMRVRGKITGFHVGVTR